MCTELNRNKEEIIFQYLTYEEMLSNVESYKDSRNKCLTYKVKSYIKESRIFQILYDYAIIFLAIAYVASCFAIGFVNSSILLVVAIAQSILLKSIYQNF